MSYILDALRKADSDRERGAVPGIHTQATPGVAGDEGRVRVSGPLVWVVLVLSALVVALLAWLFFGRESAPAPAAAPSVVASSPPPVVAMPVVAMPAPAPVLPSVAPAVPAAQPTRLAPPAPRLAAPPVARSVIAPPPPQPAASTEPRIYAISELPENIKRELPQVVVGGSIYSDSAANRFLIINGQIFHEGDKLGPELWLVQIKLKAAVLRYKDYRYTIRF